MCDRNSCTLVACDDVHFSLFLPSQSDDYNSVPALDPEKLKIFNTVREITGVCVCVCIYVFVFNVTSQAFAIWLNPLKHNVSHFRHPQYPVVA